MCSCYECRVSGRTSDMEVEGMIEAPIARWERERAAREAAEREELEARHFAQALVGTVHREIENFENEYMHDNLHDIFGTLDREFKDIAAGRVGLDFTI